ncbi:peptidyl-prolyl cis-trans isomerase (rotamase) - cyclophilin family [Rubidibacter lacunae KORDI 51-2]|uniref:Peptidyl-prolyl cis-trans isomerase n=1 Tax=Rubidibacter lacunae KORDI 51-2 TaxID=582515 RepID=U5DEH1_9CHRO|nr:peptidylprolyl isomerase [Rubidibacter lacunae]ERN40016.1 peptidyl-prolyl cis-trans isomerase (rotamase) - cyclophilin family [Rubidibacter lacunae KORDI 51-2]
MKMRVARWLAIAIAMLWSGALAACGSTPEATAVGETAASTEIANNFAGVDVERLPRLQGTATVEMVVKGQPIAIEVDGDAAPITAGNFVDLVDRGFYDGLTFHRVVREPQPFVVQGGDPTGTGTGGFIDPETQRERQIPLEIKAEGADEPVYGRPSAVSEPLLRHERGALSMARTQVPNSASSQFYIALAQLTFLDGDYAVFGTVTDGMETVDTIQQGDRIESARVTSGLENLQR